MHFFLKKGIKKRVFSDFLELYAISEAENFSKPPVFGVKEHEYHTLNGCQVVFEWERADFWPFEGLF